MAVDRGASSGLLKPKIHRRDRVNLGGFATRPGSPLKVCGESGSWLEVGPRP